MNVLAVDPGSKSGYALFVDGKLRVSDHVNVRTIKGARELDVTVEAAVMLSNEHPGKRLIMVIEGPYPPAPRMGWKTLFGMGIPRGQWEQCARKWGIKIIEVNPSEWQLPTIGRGRREQQIVKYIARAEQIAKRKPIQADEAAAIVMGDWYVREQRRKG